MMKNIYCNYIQPFSGCELFFTNHWLKPMANYILPIRAKKQKQNLTEIIENANGEYLQRENITITELKYETNNFDEKNPEGIKCN